MELRKYRDFIETFEFGAQFSIFSGFRLVLSAMDENETLQQLIGELRSSKIWRKSLLNLVKALLRSERADSQMAFDGCIAAYVYCLWKADLETGYFASTEVLKTPDLWWSAKLALLVRKEYLAEQISTSVDCTSLTGNLVSIVLTGHEYHSDGRRGRYSYFAIAFDDLPAIAPCYDYPRSSRDRIEIDDMSLTSSSGLIHYGEKLVPTDEFEMSIAN